MVTCKYCCRSTLYFQRVVLATEETTVTQQVSHRPIKCQPRSWSQRGTKVRRVTSSFSFLFISLIADGPHHYHPACGHKGSSHLSPVHALQFFYRDASSALLQLVNQWLNYMVTTRYSNQQGSKSRQNLCQVQPTKNIGNLSASRRCHCVLGTNYSFYCAASI